MARFEDGCYGSLKGIALIAKVLAGRCKMHYTRVAAGKGTIPEDLTPKTIDEPPGYVMDAMIASVTNPVDGECQVTIQLNSAKVKEGFYLTWLVLYAEDPDEGEVPFTALCLEGEPEWIRPSSSIVGKLATFDIIAAVGDVDTVTASIDPEAVATVEEVKRQLTEHNADPDAHAQQIADAITQEIKAMSESGTVVDQETVLELIGQFSGGIAKEIPFSIKPTDWKEGEGTYSFYADIPDEEITEEHRPDAILDEESTNIATYYQVCAAARSYTGYVRLRAKVQPEQEISGILYLLGKGGSGFALKPATADRLGGVKIGKGISAEPDGTASIDTDGIAEDLAGPVAEKVVAEASATDEQVDGMIDDIFGEDDKN